MDAETGQALSLTGDIYDAALDPELWPEVLRKICAFVGGSASALVSQDVATRTGGFYYSWGDDPHYTRLYFETYARINPVIVPLLLLEEGEVRSASQMLPLEELHATRFYKEWLRPAGYGDNTIGVIEKSASVVTFLATSHDHASSPTDAGPRRRTEMIFPHVRRAVAIGHVTQRNRIEAQLLADAIDALDAGVFLVDGDAVLVRANATGAEMLAAGDMLRLEGGVLTAAGGATVRAALRDAIAESATGRLAVNPRGMAIPLTDRDGNRHVAHILPLNSGARRTAATSSGASTAVFVHRAAVGGLLPLEAIARQFDLSAAELRVLMVLMEIGGSVGEVADVLGLSTATVKTHLRRLFEKTQTARQADLIRLVASYSNPLIAR